MSVQNADFYPDAAIIQVYTADDVLEDGSSGLGWVRVNLLGFIGDVDGLARKRWTVNALLTSPFAFKPSTTETQSSTQKLESPMNQQYGMITPPRRGDKAIVMHCGRGKYFVLGTYAAPGGNEPPIYTPEDLSLIHRSGASIRLNDKHPGVTAPSPDEYDGITGAMTTVANRGIHLIGSKFLPYGLMAEHASQPVNIDINDGDEDGYSYTEIFDDAEPSTTYYQPWATSATGKKFVGPPLSDLNGTNVGSDEFYLLHQGGGVLKLDNIDTNYTGFKISVGGFTISAGKEYWDAGLRNTDTSTGAHADTQSTVPAEGEILIQTSAGASIKMDTSGNIIIDSQGSIKLGGSGASNNVISDADSTSTVVGVNLLNVPLWSHPTGHNHSIVAGQTETKVT